MLRLILIKSDGTFRYRVYFAILATITGISIFGMTRLAHNAKEAKDVLPYISNMNIIIIVVLTIALLLLWVASILSLILELKSERED